ncbi:hypothetical protein N0V91_004108 [Didymella pomorum]|uniref:Uncharacterized protein n=1 Tax=Didymella pomorum TaxID=749634 RepID=A0A9W9D9S6_9PLEO|nr:hypothetical protein N0V91_004108 [Didymella pomorum]
MASNVSITNKTRNEKEAERIEELTRLHFRRHAQYLATSPLQPFDDLRGIDPTFQEHFQERLAHSESARYPKSPPISTSPMPLMPHTSKLENSPCGNVEYEIGTPGYVQFSKVQNLAAEDCPLDAIPELLDPFIGILPDDSRRDCVNLDGGELQLHPLDIIVIRPAHKENARVPKSCVLLGGLQYENYEAGNSDMDQWLVQWLRNRNLKSDIHLTDWYKT